MCLTIFCPRVAHKCIQDVKSNAFENAAIFLKSDRLSLSLEKNDFSYIHVHVDLHGGGDTDADEDLDVVASVGAGVCAGAN